MTGLNWISRILFWIVGGVFFLTISLLPNLLLAWFYTGGSAHLIVVPTAAIVVGLLWSTTLVGKPTA